MRSGKAKVKKGWGAAVTGLDEGQTRLGAQKEEEEGGQSSDSEEFKLHSCPRWSPRGRLWGQ